MLSDTKTNMIHIDFWEEIEALLETVEELHRNWCNECGEPKPETGGQRTWITSGVVGSVGRIWEQCMIDLPTTFDDNEQESLFVIEATETVKRYLEGTLIITEEDIELELKEIQETLRIRWHWFYKTHKEVSDDEKREQKDAMPRIRGGGDGNDHIDIEGIKVRDDDDPENSEFSLSKPSFLPPQSQPNLESKIGRAKLSWPSSQLHIPGSSDKFPNLASLATHRANLRVQDPS